MAPKQFPSTVFGKQDKNELPHLALCEYNISFISTSVRNNSVMELSGCTSHRARKIRMTAL